MQSNDELSKASIEPTVNNNFSSVFVNGTPVREGGDGVDSVYLKTGR